MIKVMKYKQT